MELYRAIKIPSDEPVRYVGVYVLRWGNGQPDPDVGFVPVDMDEAIPYAIDRIIEDILDRQGLKHEWRHIDPDIQDEICQTWQRLIENAIFSPAKT